MNNAVNFLPLDTSNLHQECLGVVLAGGLSSRMGCNKAALVRDNKSLLSMLDFSKQTLHRSGVHNIVVSGDNYDIPDKLKKSGPVGGILSVLAKYPHVKSLLILPVDLPFINANALTNLRVKGELSQKATYYDGHNIPLYLPNNAYLALFLAQAFTHINNVKNEKLKNGPSIKALLKQIPHQAIQSHDETILFNSNTPEQWQQAKQKLNF